MSLSERKRSMLYKNASGGKIMLKISLPKGDDGSQPEIFYGMLCEKYMEAAKRFIEGRAVCAIFCFTVTYEVYEEERYVKIKRRSRLSSGGATIDEKAFTDVFLKDGMILKK